MVVIYASDSRETKVEKRQTNESVARREYQLRAEQPRFESIIKRERDIIEDMKREVRDYDGIQGDTQFTNGERRQQFQDGRGKKFYALAFAGMTREGFLQMHSGEDRPESLGTNDLQITKKLRQRKQKLGWKEPNGHGGVRRGAGRKKN